MLDSRFKNYYVATLYLNHASYIMYQFFICLFIFHETPIEISCSAPYRACLCIWFLAMVAI